MSKMKKTMLERYGVEHAFQSPELVARGKQKILERFGVPNALQADSVIEKCLMTKAQNHSVTSPQEEELFDIIQSLGYKCVLGHAAGRFLYDIALFWEDQKIDIEYDGLYWHELHGDADRRRDTSSIENGWKVIRFQSQSGKVIPTEDQIIAAIDAAIYEDRKLQIIELAA